MKIRIHPLFLVMLFVFAIFKKFDLILLYLGVVLLHEFGHYLVAKKLGYKLDKMVLLPYGVCLSYNSECFTPKDEIKVALAGPIVNLIIAVLCLALWWLFPTSYAFTYNVCFASVITFLFNLLPAYPLDGGRVLKSLLLTRFTLKSTSKILKVCNVILASVFLIIFIISIFFKINFNYLILAIFIANGIIEFNFESKYKINSIKKSKSHLDKGIEVVFKQYSSRVYLYKIYAKLNRYKLNKIIIQFKNGKEKIFSEDKIEEYILLYGPKSTFEEIFTDLAK